jgi:hypothetical protein
MGQTREQKVLKQMTGVPTTQKFTPVATDMFLPNHSGIKSHPEFKDAIGDYLLKTGDTATGNYTFDTNTLFIDSVNHRVGIGTAAPIHLLDVNGTGIFGTSTSSRANYSGTIKAHNPLGVQTDLFLWQDGKGSAHIGFPVNSSTLYFTNSYDDGLITDPHSMVLDRYGNVGIGTTTPNESLTLGADGVLSIDERAAAPSNTAAYGKLWVKNTTPCELWFTDDAGASTKIV